MAWVCAARAGSGKTMWMTAFVLALCEMEFQDSSVHSAVRGGLVFVVQKIETLLDLEDTVGHYFPDKPNLIGVVQSFSPAGKQKGLCKNREVDSFTSCVPAECPYAKECTIAASAVHGSRTLVTGITQERFKRYRSSGQMMHNLMIRRVEGEEIPRRFLFFDERFEMTQIANLSKENLNHFSDDLEQFIQTRGLSDSKVAALQHELGFSVSRCFDGLRWMLRGECEDGQRYDLPFGLCTLQEDADACKQAVGFKGRFTAPWMQSLLTPKGRECLTVMEALGKGECLFTKTNGFRIVFIASKRIIYESAQTLIFDATAPVDGDYIDFPQIRLYDDSPYRRFNNVTFHLYMHSDCNVSKRALRSPGKQTGMQKLMEEILQNTDGKVFVSTYKEQSQTLFREGIPKQICQVNGILPYYGGTNGSNHFRECRTVILLGWPRLAPDTFLVNCYAAWGESGFREEIAATSAIFQEDGVPRDIYRQMPTLTKYETHYLAARVEQEIYRSAIRDPDCKDPIHVYLFCPPEGVWGILKTRFPGCREDVVKSLPDCVRIARDQGRKHQGKPTAYSRLCEYLEHWDGSALGVAELRDQILKISGSVWKDLMKDERVKILFARQGIAREGRGKHAKLIRKVSDAV